jgi:hypothetical protein
MTSPRLSWSDKILYSTVTSRFLCALNRTKSGIFESFLDTLLTQAFYAMVPTSTAETKRHTYLVLADSLSHIYPQGFDFGIHSETEPCGVGFW